MLGLGANPDEWMRGGLQAKDSQLLTVAEYGRGNATLNPSTVAKSD
jgi:hypothetical protein